MLVERTASARANGSARRLWEIFGALDRQALQQANLTVTYAEGPSLVGDHAFTTGQIGLESFERVLSPSTMRIGIKDGIGCNPYKLPQEEQTKAIIPDQFRHELATAYNLKGRGLVVLTACSHRGVVNTIKQAQAASGVTKVHAVIGGFHLAPYAEDYARQTIAALEEMDVDYVIPLHCTGEVFYELASLKCQPGYCVPIQEPASHSRVAVPNCAHAAVG